MWSGRAGILSRARWREIGGTVGLVMIRPVQMRKFTLESNICSYRERGFDGD